MEWLIPNRIRNDIVIVVSKQEKKLMEKLWLDIHTHVLLVLKKSWVKSIKSALSCYVFFFIFKKRIFTKFFGLSLLSRIKKSFDIDMDSHHFLCELLFFHVWWKSFYFVYVRFIWKDNIGWIQWIIKRVALILLTWFDEPIYWIMVAELRVCWINIKESFR